MVHSYWIEMNTGFLVMYCSHICAMLSRSLFSLSHCIFLHKDLCCVFPTSCIHTFLVYVFPGWGMNELFIHCSKQMLFQPELRPGLPDCNLFYSTVHPTELQKQIELKSYLRTLVGVECMFSVSCWVSLGRGWKSKLLPCSLLDWQPQSLVRTPRKQLLIRGKLSIEQFEQLWKQAILPKKAAGDYDCKGRLSSWVTAETEDIKRSR